MTQGDALLNFEATTESRHLLFCEVSPTLKRSKTDPIMWRYEDDLGSFIVFLTHVTQVGPAGKKKQK